MNPAPDVDTARSSVSNAPPPARTLGLGTRLRDYEITGLIGEGGFAVVYLAWDHSLQRKVAIKEYMPAGMASRVAGSPALVVKSERHVDTFKAGLKSFVNEARLLARFDHPSLVKVYRFWEENGTAYMAMPFYEGPTLETALAELGHVPGEAELRTWLRPVLNALSVLHDADTRHLDIGPDSILLTPMGPVLLGFASANHTVAALNHRSAAALKPGFAAIELYGSEAGSRRGPWTDLYALAAVVHAAISGAAPVAAADRLAQDRVQPLARVAAGLYSASFLAAIDAALAVQPELRPQDHLQFRALMRDMDAPETPVSLAPQRDLMHEPFLFAETRGETTVPDPPALPQAVPAAAKTAVAARPARPAVEAEGPGERNTPSWMRGTDLARRAFGKRFAYGLIALTFAMIGVAALALQYYGRKAERPALAATPAALPAAIVVPPGSAAPPASAALPAPAVPAALPAVATAVPPPTVSPAPLQVPATTTTTATPPVLEPTSPAERLNRCTYILQKASLEPISAAETEFYKKECK
ncbi:MAG: serine/threonine-protein kinase [Caldimonas sp.]